MDLYRQAEQILVDEAPILPTTYDRLHLLLKPWVRRFHPSPMKQRFWHEVIIEREPYGRLCRSRRQRAVDSRELAFQAFQVILANGATLGIPGLGMRLGRDVKPDDGRIEVCIFLGDSFAEHVRQLWAIVRGRARPYGRYECWMPIGRSPSARRNGPFPFMAKVNPWEDAGHG